MTVFTVYIIVIVGFIGHNDQRVYLVLSLHIIPVERNRCVQFKLYGCRDEIKYIEMNCWKMIALYWTHWTRSLTIHEYSRIIFVYVRLRIEIFFCCGGIASEANKWKIMIFEKESRFVRASLPLPTPPRGCCGCCCLCVGKIPETRNL